MSNTEIVSRTTTANGYRMHYIECGPADGPMVLFVHGFPELSHSWRNQLPVLAEAGYHAVAVDNLGYGRSAKPVRQEDYRLTEVVAGLVDVVKAAGHTEAVIVGHDWGAPVSWTAAWTRPDVFKAIMALGVPFGGRGQMGFPGSVHGELKPLEIERRIAGDDLIFYQEYFRLPYIPEQEFEENIREWLTGVYYTHSADFPKKKSDPIDVETTDLETVLGRLRESGLCLEPGAKFKDRHPLPEGDFPAWMSPEDLDHYVAEYERTGISGALNHYYRALDLNWEVLGPWEGKPVEVPAMFVTSDGDGPMLWSREAIDRMETAVPQLRGIKVLDDCGHWIQQEKPEEFNAILLEFLADVRPIAS